LILKGISLGGIPLPSAWLGNLKGKDFIEEFGQDEGFWKQFSDGIEYLEVQDGRLKVKLKE
ncbi:MAG: arginine N-succinyltransferase, partial [Verrucomicrobiales bacterium]